MSNRELLKKSAEKPEKQEKDGQVEGEATVEDQKKQLQKEGMKLGAKFHEVSTRLAKVKEKLSPEVVKTIQEGETPGEDVDLSLVEEFKSLDAEWEGLSEQVHAEMKKLDALVAAENTGKANEAGIDLGEKQKTLTKRLAKLREKLKTAQDKDVQLINRMPKFDLEANPRDSTAYFDLVDSRIPKAREVVRETALAYLATQAELDAITNGDWSEKPPEAWLPATDTKIPAMSEEWKNTTLREEGDFSKEELASQREILTERRRMQGPKWDPSKVNLEEMAE